MFEAKLLAILIGKISLYMLPITVLTSVCAYIALSKLTEAIIRLIGDEDIEDNGS